MSKSNSPQKFVFVADDDEDDRLLFLDAAAELELPVLVRAAQDGQELLKALHESVQQLPEIIFLDINMPGKNGFDCLREIRSAKEDFKAIKIGMLSTSSSPGHIDLSNELGADFYAVKPSNYQDLKKLLERIFTKDWSSSHGLVKFLSLQQSGF
ncbi:response regulator [uncultured Flavobacterium sp.]|uniref:response regulator n=1 Tax=uncultured Flavobacterium sp. TaxID=165435 RepID=UPI0025F089E4|nr:response regulator [uncultured Flavobacterium sp.]